jgi:hypothetical protein
MTLDPTTGENGKPADRRATANYIAALSADLAEIARQHGFDTLGYVLEMARLEAEALATQGQGPEAT